MFMMMYLIIEYKSKINSYYVDDNDKALEEAKEVAKILCQFDEEILIKLIKSHFYEVIRKVEAKMSMTYVSILMESYREVHGVEIALDLRKFTRKHLAKIYKIELL